MARHEAANNNQRKPAPDKSLEGDAEVGHEEGFVEGSGGLSGMDESVGGVMQLTNIVVSVEPRVCRGLAHLAGDLAPAPGHIGPPIFQRVNVQRARVD